MASTTQKQHVAARTSPQVEPEASKDTINDDGCLITPPGGVMVPLAASNDVASKHATPPPSSSQGSDKARHDQGSCETTFNHKDTSDSLKKAQDIVDQSESLRKQAEVAEALLNFHHRRFGAKLECTEEVIGILQAKDPAQKEELVKKANDRYDNIRVKEFEREQAAQKSLARAHRELKSSRGYKSEAPIAEGQKRKRTTTTRYH